MFGPPLAYWTGRFESKHRVAKSTAESVKNVINITKGAIQISYDQGLVSLETFKKLLFRNGSRLFKNQHQPSLFCQICPIISHELLPPLIRLLRKGSKCARHQGSRQTKKVLYFGHWPNLCDPPSQT